MIKNIKVRKTLVWTLKLLLFVGVLYFFLRQIAQLKLSQFQTLRIEHFSYWILVIMLLPINWSFELIKWSFILKLNKVQYSLKRLIYSLFAGVATGIVTPNRIGNFIGRMFFFKGKLRGQLILGTLYSNLSQFLITLIFGSVSFILLYEVIFETYGTTVVNSVLSISVLSFLFYFSVPFLPLPKLKFLHRKKTTLKYFQKQSKKLVLPFICYSTLRYLVFTSQFLLTLMAFGEPFSVLLCAGIFLLYFVSTLTPNLFFGKIIVRETAGLMILSVFVDNEAIIVVSSLFIWFVNLGIPSLLGLFFILRNKSFANA